MNKQTTIVVIGAGAAGYFAAINAAQNFQDKRVILLEKSNKVLSKVKVSGGGRCNVTHACFDIHQFSKNYRMLTVIAIFTVFPYLVHDAYVTKMNESAQQAVELFKPLENYASQLAQVDQVEKSAQESLVIYRQDYKLNHNGQDISEQHAAQAYQYFYNRFKKAEEAARTP